jgi:hypothetical protein
MGLAKQIRIFPIGSTDANRFVRKHHYSGKVVQNSQLHFGCFLNGRLGGVLQFGPSLDKRKLIGLVSDTHWNGFIELNRLAFSDLIPRNGESRAIGFVFRFMKINYPHIEWVVSFADATQCGDGTIYRASGFVLTGINKNKQIWKAPTGDIFDGLTLKHSGINSKEGNRAKNIISHVTKRKYCLDDGACSMSKYRKFGFVPLEGFQLRYVYFLNSEARKRLTVPEIPFSEIDKMGASMYKGIKRSK